MRRLYLLTPGNQGIRSPTHEELHNTVHCRFPANRSRRQQQKTVETASCRADAGGTEENASVAGDYLEAEDETSSE